jgi:hypothetical protein
MKQLATVEINKKIILWFDPNPRNNQYEERAFTKMGFKIVRATTIAQAQELLAKRHDVIITHYGYAGQNKEDSNAYKLLRWINASGIERRPIVIYSLGGTEHACSAQNDGFYDETDDAYYLFSAVLLAIQGQQGQNRC